MTNLEQQIEDAFHYRGHVTLTFNDSKKIEAFVYNREFNNPALDQDNFIEVFLAGSGLPEKYEIQDIAAIDLSGTDCAQGKSYQEWLEKQKKKKSSPSTN